MNKKYLLSIMQKSVLSSDIADITWEPQTGIQTVFTVVIAQQPTNTGFQTSFSV